ncbi:6-phosphofructokinase, partial [bacterium]|nr:6-phosphofructokinase [bacterium]
AVAPGMNMAVRTVVRMAVAAGHRAFCVEGGIEGLINGTLREYKWMDVTGWAGLGGAKINTGRENPTLSAEKIKNISDKIKSIRENLKKNNINALVMIGGLVGYEIIASLSKPELGINIPMICIPASIDNNLPGSDFSIGVDTALNNIVNCVDKIKRSQTVSRRCFLIEVMGNKCGYLALMSGLASGAEHVYINEVSKKTEDFLKDIELLKYEFKNSSRRVGLIINNENANSYTTEELERMFEIESEDIYDVRKAILGHIQQGGDPSPFDRTFAARISEYAMDWLCNEVFKAMDEKREYDEDDHVFVGFAEGKYKRYGIHRYANMVNNQLHRPVMQWWEDLIKLNDDLSERCNED